MSFRSALLAAATLALPVAAQAQPVNGLYVGAGAGLNLLMETDVDLGGRIGAPRNGSADFKPGYVGVLSLGYGYGNGVRAEIELSYRRNEVDTLTGMGLAAPATTKGAVQSYGAIFNALYDFDLGPSIPVVPYIGLGAGVIWQDYDSVRGTSGVNQVEVVGSSAAFAFQAIVGAAYALDAITPGLALTAEYRFMGTTGHEIDANTIRTGTAALGNAEVTNYNHSLLLGLRYAFNAPAAAAAPVATAPAAAPAPARSFLVFFDFDRATLTDRARAILAEAAQAAQTAATTRIELAGHADRAGTPQYNQRLSERRAAAVAAELERRGIPRTSMVIQSFGESRPLVPTADGIREQQNRRVEIVLR